MRRPAATGSSPRRAVEPALAAVEPAGAAGSRRRWPARLRRVAAVAVVAVAGGGTLAACGGPSSYTVRAVFANAEDLYPGNAVEVLGVSRGTVTKVEPDGGSVVVTMAIDGGQRLPADVDATLSNPEILGTPDVELSPGYTGGPSLAAGSTIPERRTVVPISINALLLDLQKTLAKIDPSAVGGVVSALSTDLNGQGQKLNQLIGQGAGTLQLLADKGDQLGQLDGSLAAITGTLRQETSQVTQLLQSYDTVAGVLDANSQPLGQAISALAAMSQDLATLLSPNLQPLQQDIATITQVGRTLDRNLPTVDQTLTAADELFAGAQRAYDAPDNWLNLNLQLAPGETSGIEAGQLRDILAGICRRLAANHASSFPGTVLQTLDTCGNPDSGYFDQLLGLVPGLLGSGTSSASSTSAAEAFDAGLDQIPGLSDAQRQALASLSPSALSGLAGSSGSSGSSGSTVTPSAANDFGLDPATPQSAPSSSSGGVLGNLVHGLFGAVGFLQVGR